jgi:general stress protein CsbA
LQRAVPLGLLLAVQLLYLLLHTGPLDNENAGLENPFLLALTTFFAGINIDWRLLIVGLILSLALVGAAYLKIYFRVFLLIGLVVISTFLLLKRHGGN